MAQQPPPDTAIGIHGHGLRFLNEEWNDSISNGQPFTLKWNQSLVKTGAQLGLFKIRYPADGVVVYDLVSNLSGSIDSVSYKWTPENLGKKLYSLWLSDGQDARPNWAVSPPWIPKEEESKSRLHWAAPIVIPVVSLLVLYAICLSIYLSYRRRKREKREKEDATPHQDVSRNNSVDSAITVQTFTETDDTLKSKPSIWLITSPPGESDITTQGLWKDDDGADAPVTRASTLAAHSPV